MESKVWLSISMMLFVLDRFLFLYAADLYSQTFLRCKTILWKSVLWLLQWGFHYPSSQRMYLCHGRELICSQWSQTLCKALWHDRQKCCCHPETNASKSCWVMPKVRWISRFPSVDIMSIQFWTICHICRTKEKGGLISFEQPKRITSEMKESILYFFVLFFFESTI